MMLRSLLSNVPRDLAFRKMASGGIGGMARRRFRGHLLGIAEIHIPYRAYSVTIHDRHIDKKIYYAVDAVAGTLDPFEFAKAPGKDELVDVETRNFLPVCLDDQRTRGLAIEGVRRSLYRLGFFRLKNPVIAVDSRYMDYYLPYWAGFYGDQKNVSLLVLNGVRQTYEGGKLRRLIRDWLLEEPTRATRPAGEAQSGDDALVRTMPVRS